MGTISVTMWFVWALIGLIGGFMLGRLMERGQMYTLLSVVIAATFAMGGGWLFCKYVGATDKLQYISLVVAVASCTVGLWLFWLCTKRSGDSD